MPLGDDRADVSFPASATVSVRSLFVPLQNLSKTAFRTFLAGERHDLDKALWGRDEWLEHSEQLLHASVGVSSQDRSDEVGGERRGEAIA